MNNMKRKCLVFLGLFLFSFFSAVVLADEGQFDIYGGWKGLKGEETGWFHTEQINGRWWIITPKGNVFWSAGMYCVRFGGLPETGTGKRVYRDACIKKYGSEKEWARITKLQLKDWGFNTIGDWSSESIYRDPGLAYVMGINLPNKAPNVMSKGAYGYFPDVFSEEFRESVKRKIQDKFSRQAYLINDPWLLGYFLADEPSWYGSKGRRGALVDDFIKLSGDKPGKIAWVKFVKTIYLDVRGLNKSWGTNFKSIDELLLVDKILDNENTKKDKLSFLKVIADEFSRVLYESLRSFDKNHMILGTRPTRLYPEVVAAIGKYSDVFSMSAYGFNQGYKIDKEFSRKIDDIYKSTQKPIMLGVLISAQDTGLPFGIVRTQKDRGVSYWRYVAKIASDSRVVGVHWFQYFDPPRKCYDKRAANWGVVNEKDEPYEEAVSLISQANKMVYAYALGLSEFAPEFDSLLVRTEVTKSYPNGHRQSHKATSDNLKNIELPIANSGFEQGKKNWGLQVWKGNSKASIDSSVKHSGKYSLKVKGGSNEGWGSVGVGVQSKLQFVLKPEYQYRLSCWVKVKNVEDSAFVRIKVKYKNGEAGYFGTEGVYGTENWKLVEVKFSPREENTVEYLGAQLVGRGVAWFDDVMLEGLVSSE